MTPTPDNQPLPEEAFERAEEKPNDGHDCGNPIRITEMWDDVAVIKCGCGHVIVIKPNAMLSLDKESALADMTAQRDAKAAECQRLAQRLLDENNRFTAELDAVRKTFDALGVDFHQQADELDASQARCGELERALSSAIQSLERYGPTVAEGHICGPESQCDGLCMEVAHFANFIEHLRKLLTPSQQPEPEHVKAGEWLPIESAPKTGMHIRIFEPDGYYEITGLYHNGRWLTFPGLTECFPTHWQSQSAPPIATEEA